MIRKFQQGGNQQQQLDQILTMLDQNPQETLQQLLQNGMKPEDVVKLVQLGVQKGKIRQEVGQAILNAFAKKAKHGAKLNYIKSLKHKCADDEEPYYLRKGGNIVDCGCKKKDGGTIAEEDTIHTKKGIRDLSGKTKYPRFNPKEATKEERRRASDKDYLAGRGDHDMIPEKKKKVVLKHFNGGNLSKWGF